MVATGYHPSMVIYHNIRLKFWTPVPPRGITKIFFQNSLFGYVLYDQTIDADKEYLYKNSHKCYVKTQIGPFSVQNIR